MFRPKFYNFTETNKIFYLSPTKVIIYKKQQGRDFTYSDYWHNEQCLVMTQIQPESEQVKCTDFKVDVQYHLNIDFKKSCMVKALIEKEHNEGFATLV